MGSVQKYEINIILWCGRLSHRYFGTAAKLAVEKKKKGFDKVLTRFWAPKLFVIVTSHFYKMLYKSKSKQKSITNARKVKAQTRFNFDSNFNT